MPYATLQDVETRFGRTLTTSERGQVTAWIGDIEAQIKQRIPDIDTRISEGYPTAAVVTAIVCNAVIRVLKNPEMARQRQFSIDDYSESLTLDNVISSGKLYITDEEWNLLAPGSSGDAFTITPSYVGGRAGEWVHPDTWVPLA